MALKLLYDELLGAVTRTIRTRCKYMNNFCFAHVLVYACAGGSFRLNQDRIMKSGLTCLTTELGGTAQVESSIIPVRPYCLGNGI